MHRSEFFVKRGVISVAIDDINVVWHLINALYIASMDGLGKISWDLRNRPMVWIIFGLYILCVVKSLTLCPMLNQDVSEVP